LFLLIALLCLGVLFLLNWLGVRRLSVYLLVGLALWFSVLYSGVHVTVTGVLLALCIPLTTQEDSPAQRLEYSLQPWVTFFIMPLFALANAGLPLQGISVGILSSSLVLGSVFGLFLGKQWGVLGFTWLAIKLNFAKLPANTSWLQLYGIAILCGIGFTMSLFLGTLTFEETSPTRMIEVRLGVLLGSALSGLFGAVLLQAAFKKSPQS